MQFFISFVIPYSLQLAPFMKVQINTRFCMKLTDTSTNLKIDLFISLIYNNICDMNNGIMIIKKKITFYLKRMKPCT